MINVIVFALFSPLNLYTPKKNKVMETQMTDTQELRVLKRHFIAYMEQDPSVLKGKCPDKYSFIHQIVNKLDKFDLQYLTACVAILVEKRFKEKLLK